MITALSIGACALTMFCSWLVSRGRLRVAYLAGIVNGSLYTAINILIAIASPDQAGVLLLAIPSTWGVAMCLAGLARLRREQTQPIAQKED